MINNTMDNIIVAGANHYNTLWLVRSLGMAGYTPFVVISSTTRDSFVVKSKYCNSYMILDSDESVVEFLLKRNIDSQEVLLSSSDRLTQLFDLNYDKLSKKYLLQNCFNKQGQLTSWMNKDKMLKMAKECGLMTPDSFSLNVEELRVDFSKVSFPCLIKPETSAEASKDNFYICYDIDDLKKSLNDVTGKCSKVLVQDYIRADYEYLLYGVSTDSEVLIPGGLKKIHTCSSMNNMGMMSYGVLSEYVPLQIGNYDIVKEYVKSIGYKGLFSVEFLITQDKAYFLEINLRNDGTCYMTTQAGVNLPALWCGSVLGKNTSHVQRQLLRKKTYGMNEVNYFKYTFSWKYFIRCIKEIFSVKAFSLIKWNDMKPVVFKLLYAFK